MVRALRIFGAALLFWLGSAGAATLSGTVHDPSGAGAFNAQISLRNEATGEVRYTLTDGDGRFSIDIPPGDYQVQTALAGFATVEQRVKIEESRPEILDIKLALAETRSEVN